MSIRMTIASLCFVLPLASVGCQIHTCEEGATCHDDDDPVVVEAAPSQRDSCIAYCGRVSVCGGAQANDFEACVKSCERRFEVLPEQTRNLCECAEASRCSDVVEGRCTPPGGSGGSSSSGAAPSQGGSVSGGASSEGGSVSGGASSEGGGASGGASSSGGASTGSGGSSSGTDGGAAGAPCSAACDCNADQSCVSGRCTPNRA